MTTPETNTPAAEAPSAPRSAPRKRKTADEPTMVRALLGAVPARSIVAYLAERVGLNDANLLCSAILSGADLEIKIFPQPEPSEEDGSEED